MYLDDLDDLLIGGADSLGRELRERQRRYVLALQQPDGGFGGRRGPSDLYYTDFSLRVLTLTQPADGVEDPALARAAGFLAANGRAPVDVVSCFNVLNSARMLGRMMRSQPGPLPAECSAALSRWNLPSGGVARQGGDGVSAYATFLAALSREMLDESFPDAPAAVQAIQRLKRPDGGYADMAGAASGQTSATAAAIAFLTMNGAPAGPDAGAVDFLCAMQAADGGFRACPGAPESDLLSTYTALVSLLALGGMKRVNLLNAVRFIGGLAFEQGGFGASPSDAEPDAEYTCYGLSTLALMRVFLAIHADETGSNPAGIAIDF